MVLDKQRARGNRLLKPVATRFIKINPDTLSWLAFSFAILAALVLYLSSGDTNFINPDYAYVLLIIASVFIGLNGFFDMLDGLIAKLSGKASKRGDFLDHVLDRYADLFMMLGIIISGYCHIYIGLFGLIGVFLTSYMGTQAQAIGVKRDYSGLLGRADRLAILIFAPLVLFFHIWLFDGPILPWISDFWIDFTIFDIMMLWFGIAGNLTAIQRARRTWRVLSRKS